MGAILKHSSIHSAAVLLHQGGATAEAVKGGMTQQTPFATASVSKLYTHAIVFRLIDQGLVGYDAELGSLLPAEEVGRLPHGASVTVRQLIDQTTGFADFESERQRDGTVLFEQLLRPGGRLRRRPGDPRAHPREADARAARALLRRERHGAGQGRRGGGRRYHPPLAR